MTSSVVPETRPFLEKSRADPQERASAAARSAETNRARPERSTPAERADPTGEAPELTGPVRDRIRESLQRRAGLAPIPGERDLTLAELAPAHETHDLVRAELAPIPEEGDLTLVELAPTRAEPARCAPTSHARFRPRR